MGTTAEKLTYLNDTKLAIKNELNKLGAEIQDNDTFRSYVNKLKAIYNDYPTVSDTGSSISLNNTKKTPFKEISLNSTELTQDGTPTPSSPVAVNVIKGDNNVVVQNKNLSNGINQNVYLYYDCSNCGQLSGNSGLYIPVDGGYYTVSTTTTQTRYRIACIDNKPSETAQTAYSGSNRDNTKDTIIINTTGHKYLVVNATDLSSIQIEKGQTATDFIEHQEQNYPISLASKNLFAGGNPFSFNVLLDYPLKLEAGTYYLKCGNMTQSPSETSMESPIIVINNQPISIPKNANKTFTLSSPIEKVNFYSNGWSYPNSINVTATIEDLIISKENVNYEPYQPTIEYCEIGDYRDRFFKNVVGDIDYDNTLVDGDWYLKKNIGKVILNGSENWGKIDMASRVNTSLFYLAISNMSNIGNNVGLDLKSNYFDAKDVYNNDLEGCEQIRAALFLSIKKTSLSSDDATGFKNWLSTNNTILYYVLSTPTYIHITPTDYPTLKTQLDNIYNNSKSYNGQTNITQTNDGLPFNLSVKILEKINI